MYVYFRKQGLGMKGQECMGVMVKDTSFDGVEVVKAIVE